MTPSRTNRARHARPTEGTSGKGRRQLVLLVVGMTAAALAVPNALAAPPPAPYFNGFESAADVDFAAYANEALSNATRVPSGTNGISSASGGWHAESSMSAGSFTRYGGYSGTFPDGGYTTSIDIYLDMSKSTGGDIRADWSSAISNPSGGHRRDFIFSLGTNPASAGEFCVSASNNSPGWPCNPGRTPLAINSSGWYTFQHTFYDGGTGSLAVDMSVLSGGNELASWQLSDPTDVIGGTVGGNRYGWMVTNGFPFLALDNINRSGTAPYTFEGFFQPVDNGSTNVVKAGQTVPVKWRVLDAGVPVSDPASFVSLSSVKVNCGTLDGAVDRIEEITTNASGLTYHNDGNWQFNWKTPKAYAGTCRVMTVELSDGSTRSADFRFKN